MAKKRGLGKGLGALIPELNQEKELVTEKQEEKNKGKSTKSKVNKYTDTDLKKTKDSHEILDNVVLIDLKDIIISGENPRKNFDDEAIKSLGESIKQYGVLQPIVLQEKDDKYEIVAGERRFRAAKSIHLEKIPAIVKTLENKDKDMISMVENIQREDLNPYEEAQAYSNLMKSYNMTQAELSELIGKSRTYIANIVRLLALDDFTITELENGNITSSQGRALLGIKDVFDRKKYLDLLVRKEITVNEIEKKASKRRSKVVSKDVFVQDIEDRLKVSLGTPVNVKKSKNKWTVNIEFASDEQIEEFLSHYDLGE